MCFSRKSPLQEQKRLAPYLDSGRSPSTRNISDKALAVRLFERGFRCANHQEASLVSSLGTPFTTGVSIFEMHTKRASGTKKMRTTARFRSFSGTTLTSIYRRVRSVTQRRLAWPTDSRRNTQEIVEAQPADLGSKGGPKVKQAITALYTPRNPLTDDQSIGVKENLSG